MRDSVLSAFVVFASVLSVIGILQWFTAGGRVFWLIQTPFEDEIMATFLNRDHYAVFVELLLPIPLIRALSGSKGAVKYGLASGFLYASVVTTGSRAGTALVTLEAACLMLIAHRSNIRKKGSILALACTLIVFATAAGWEYLWFRFNQQDLFAFRREMAIATLDMIRTKPWTGFGIGTWPNAYPAFAVFDPPGFYMNHAHSDWLEWFADGGVLFPACMLAVFADSVRSVRHSQWAFGVPVAFLHAAVDFPLHKPAIAATLFFLLGAAVSSNMNRVGKVGGFRP